MADDATHIEHPSLPAALAAFQAEVPVVSKSNTAKVDTKSGGSYSYKYADLADICRVTYPFLGRHGLSFIALPEFGSHGLELVGELLHESGESKKASLPILGTSAQEIGGSLTYMRRYLYGCLTGVVTDADDDAAANRSTEQRQVGTLRERPTRPATRTSAPATNDPWATDVPAVDPAEVKTIIDTAKGITDLEALRGTWTEAAHKGLLEAEVPGEKGVKVSEFLTQRNVQLKLKQGGLETTVVSDVTDTEPAPALTGDTDA